MNKKILIIKGGGESFKLERLIEEAEKRGVVIDVIDCCSIGLSAKIEDNIPNFDDYNFVLSLDNQTYCNYFINLFALKGFRTWPSQFVLKINDKFLQAQFLNSIGIKHPKTILVNTLEKDFLNDKVEDLLGGFPCVIKKVTGSFGSHVAKVNSAKEIEDFVKFKNEEVKLRGKSSYLLQEFIKEASGEDFRVLLLNGEIIGGMKRKTSNSSDFRANISLGGTSSKFEIPEEVKNICFKIFDNSEIFYLGVDLIKKDNDWYVIEINSCAQFEGFEKITKVNVAEKIIGAISEIK